VSSADHRLARDGNVTGGAGSVVGGFLRREYLRRDRPFLRDRAASGGTGSTVGGFGGLNIGTVNVALRTVRPPEATTVSWEGSSASITRLATRSQAWRAARFPRPMRSVCTGGANSYVAGFVAINVGSLDQTLATGL